MLEVALFIIMALLAVGGASGLLFARDPIYCLLLGVLSFFALAGLFMLLDAPFLATVQVIVYAGAIMVLFLFVIMLLSPSLEILERVSLGSQVSLGVLLAVGLLGAIGMVIYLSFGGDGAQPRMPAGQSVWFGSSQAVGRYLLTDFVVPFEFASVLLFVAVVGAVVLAKRVLK